jgi:hypothetical protein
VIEHPKGKKLPKRQFKSEDFSEATAGSSSLDVPWAGLERVGG